MRSLASAVNEMLMAESLFFETVGFAPGFQGLPIRIIEEPALFAADAFIPP
jgi:hypothetical protein